MSKETIVLEHIFLQYKALVCIRKRSYKGLARVYYQHFMEVMEHNLYRYTWNNYGLFIEIDMIN
ncbi:MAG: hypothetical protein ACMUEL_02755 [Flavobacteriales bacterium Tduv]